MFHTIVVGVKSGSDPAQLLELATSVAADGASLHLVTFVQVGKDDDQRARLETAERHLETHAAGLRGSGRDVTVHASIAPINAGSGLVQYAAQHDADLLVIGLGKRSRVGKALLGSDAQTALLTADCAVLSVHL